MLSDESLHFFQKKMKLKKNTFVSNQFKCEMRKKTAQNRPLSEESMHPKWKMQSFN